MNMMRRVVAAIRNEHPQTPLPAIVHGSSMGDLFAGVNGLPAVNERSILTVSAAYACVNLIAGAISALPMNLFTEASDGERNQIHNDDLWWTLNEQFCPRWSAANGWEYLVQSLLFHGDAFAIIKRPSPMSPLVVGIEPIHPNRVTVCPSADGMRLIYVVQNDLRTPGVQSGYAVYDQDDILHVAGFGFDGCRGLSPLKNHLMMTGAAALASQEYAARFFANGARSDFVFASDQRVAPEDAQRFQEAWDERHKGLANTHKVAVLGSGLKPHNISMSAEDAQLLGTRQFDIEEVSRIFGVPPFMIGHTAKTTSWGSGIETMGQGFVRFTLRQHLNKFQNEINRKFFRTAGKVAEFDTFELEKADMKTLFEAFQIALGSTSAPGFMTAEEVRGKINLKKLPGGSTLQTGGSNAPESNA